LNLEFKLFPSGRIQISGSLHKYWNNGYHNYNAFNLNHVLEVIKDLEMKFGIDPFNMRLENLEFGVNISLTYNPNVLLDNLVSFKKRSFDNMKTFGQEEEKL
jgi:hypothetical protein